MLERGRWRSRAGGLLVAWGGAAARRSVLSGFGLKLAGCFAVCALVSTAVPLQCWGITGSACLSRPHVPTNVVVVVMMMISEGNGVAAPFFHL